MIALPPEELHRRDQAIRAAFADDHAATGERALKREFLALNPLAHLPFVIENEWHVVHGASQEGVGDLVLTDGDGRFAAVEFKVPATGSGGGKRRNVRDADRKRRRKVEQQAKDYAGHAYRRYEGVRWVEGYSVHSLPDGVYLEGRHDAAGWHAGEALRELGYAPDHAWWTSWEHWEASPTLADHVTVLDRVLAARDTLPERKVCLFATQVGAAYQTGTAWSPGGLMVVGRAVNGWRNTLPLTPPPSQITLEDTALAELLAARSKATSPLQWVLDRWGAGKSYRTSKSAFWRVTRAVALASGAPEDAWANHLAWSNLYRVAPAVTGNPSPKLCHAQYDFCLNQLRTDIARLSPSRLLFLTGRNWFAPFGDDLGVVFTRSADHPDVHAGTLDGTPLVVAPHPQGKPEAELVAAIAASWPTPTASERGAP